jgi:hypothetical protein
VTTGTFKVGRWRRATRVSDNRVAEGPIVLDDIEITVSLHYRDSRLYWISFPRNVRWLNQISLHSLTTALVQRLKATQSEIYWSAIDRASPADRADLQAKVRLHLLKGGQP